MLSGEKSVAQIAKAYGVHTNSVNAWKRAFLDKGPEVFSQDSEVKAYERRIAELERLLGQKKVRGPGIASYYVGALPRRIGGWSITPRGN